MDRLPQAYFNAGAMTPEQRLRAFASTQPPPPVEDERQKALAAALLGGQNMPYGGMGALRRRAGEVATTKPALVEKQTRAAENLFALPVRMIGGILDMPRATLQAAADYTADSSDPYNRGQVVERAFDAAGMVTGGSFAGPAVKDAAGMGVRAYHGTKAATRDKIMEEGFAVPNQSWNKERAVFFSDDPLEAYQFGLQKAWNNPRDVKVIKADVSRLPRLAA